MAKTQKESQFKSAVYRWLSFQPNTFCWINRTAGIPLPNGGFRPNDQAGISDITGIHGGKFFALELKVGKNKATPEQEKFLISVDRVGGYSAVIRSMEDLEEAFNEIKR